MFKKNDPLVDSVRAVMEVSEFDRQIEAAVNEEFGVTSKNALPHELKHAYEQRLAEAKKCMYEGGAEGSIPKTPREKDLAKKHGNPNRITKGDVLKARGVIEEDDLDEKWHEEANVAPGKKPITTPAKGAKKAIEEDNIRIDPNGGGLGPTGPAPKPSSTGVPMVPQVPKPIMKEEGAPHTFKPSKSKDDAGKGIKVTDKPKSNLDKPLTRTFRPIPKPPSKAEAIMREEEQLDEISQKKAIETLRDRAGDPEDPHPKAPAVLRGMRKRWGQKSVNRARKAMAVGPWGREQKSEYADENDPLEFSSHRKKEYTKGGKLTKKSTEGLKQAHRRAIEDMRDKRAPRGVPKKQLPEETQLDEKAVSKAQHRFFGLVRGIQKGKAHGSEKAEKAASEMSVKSVRDYAKTKEAGLPEKKEIKESFEQFLKNRFLKG